MQVEDAGIKFYDLFSKLAKDKASRNIFIELSRQEQYHKETFKKLSGEYRPKNSEIEYSVDVSAVFLEDMEKLKNEAFALEKTDPFNVSFEKAINIAIDAEMDAINTYTELFTKVIESFYGVLLRIINEEKEHLRILENIRNGSA